MSSSSTLSTIEITSPSNIATVPPCPSIVAINNDPTLLKSYSEILIDDDLWISRIDDRGCDQNKLSKRSYKQNKIPGVKTAGATVFHIGLSSIAIDYLKMLVNEKELGRGWDKTPRNKSDAKLKIIESLIAMRYEDSNRKYILDQRNFIGTLERI